MAIVFFHAFTGCDLVSNMYGIGKKTAWSIWSRLPELTQTMITLTENPDEFTEDSVHMAVIEKFTVLMYNKTSSKSTVNEARQFLFTHKLKSLESIPPTKAALFQHTKRAVLVSSFIWHRANQRILSIPDPSVYGWEWNDRLLAWVPYWTDLDDASSACALMLHCGCKKSCSKKCKCAQAGLRCTPLCNCEAGCTRNNLY